MRHELFATYAARLHRLRQAQEAYIAQEECSIAAALLREFPEQSRGWALREASRIYAAREA